MRLYSLNKYIHIRPLAIDWEVKSGEREKDKTLVDKKSTSGGIPAPSPSLHFWCWKNCVNSTQKSHTQSQRMATMRERSSYCGWIFLSIPRLLVKDDEPFLPYFLFLRVHQIDPPSLLWPVRPNFAFCRHTHTESVGVSKEGRKKCVHLAGYR